MMETSFRVGNYQFQVADLDDVQRSINRLFALSENDDETQQRILNTVNTGELPTFGGETPVAAIEHTQDQRQKTSGPFGPKAVLSWDKDDVLVLEEEKYQRPRAVKYPRADYEPRPEGTWGP